MSHCGNFFYIFFFYFYLNYVIIKVYRHCTSLTVYHIYLASYKHSSKSAIATKSASWHLELFMGPKIQIRAQRHPKMYDSDLDFTHDPAVLI